MKNIILVVLGLTMSVVLFSCTFEPKSKQSTESSEDVSTFSKEYTSDYICPMHCKGSGSSEPGHCPVCNMKYVANSNSANSEIHQHQHQEQADTLKLTYSCPMHPEITGDEGDSCSICKMQLTKNLTK